MSSTNDNDPTKIQFFTNGILQRFKNPTDSLIFDLLLTEGPMTRGELVEATDIARSTIYDALLRMMIKKKVSKFKERIAGKPGSPKVYFKVKDTDNASPAPLKPIM